MLPERSSSSQTPSLLASDIEMHLASEDLSPTLSAPWRQTSCPQEPIAGMMRPLERSPVLMERPPVLPPFTVQPTPADTPECATPVAGASGNVGSPAASRQATPTPSPTSPTFAGQGAATLLNQLAHGHTHGPSSNCCRGECGSLVSSYGSYVATGAVPFAGSGAAAGYNGAAAPPLPMLGPVTQPAPTVTAPNPNAAAMPATVVGSVAGHSPMAASSSPRGAGTAGSLACVLQRRSRSDERQEARIFYDARFLPNSAERSGSKERVQRQKPQKPEVMRTPRRGTCGAAVGTTTPRCGGTSAPITPRQTAGTGACAASGQVAASTAPAALAQASKRCSAPGGTTASGSAGSCSGGGSGSVVVPASARERSLPKQHGQQQARSPPPKVIGGHGQQISSRGSWAPGMRRPGSPGSPGVYSSRQTIGGSSSVGGGSSLRDAAHSKEPHGRDFNSRRPASPRAVIGSAARNTGAVHGIKGLESPGVGSYTPSAPGQPSQTRGGVVPQARRFHYESNQLGTFLSKGEEGWWR